MYVTYSPVGWIRVTILTGYVCTTRLRSMCAWTKHICKDFYIHTHALRTILYVRTYIYVLYVNV